MIRRAPYVFGLALGLSAPVFAQTLTHDATQAPAQTITRHITLSELGYQNGFSFSRLSGQSDLFFPVPDVSAVQSANLIINYEGGATAAAERFLQVIINGRVKTSIDLTQVPAAGIIEVPIDIPANVGDFLAVTLRYSGSTTEHVCVDERESGYFLEIAAQSRLELALNPARLETAEVVSRMQPPNTRVAVGRAVLSEDALAAALRAGIIYGAETGQVRYSGLAQDGSFWTEAQVSVDDQANGPFAATLQAKSTDGWPTIAIGGDDPQQAFGILQDAWSGITSQGAVATDGVRLTSTGSDAVSFADLGFDLRPQYATGTATFDFAFDVADISRGKRPESVSLLIAAAEGRGDGNVSVTAFMNNTIIGGGTLAGGQPQWFDFDIPAGLDARNNLLRVQVVRQSAGGACIYAPQSYPAQVLAASSFTLAERDASVQDFYLLRQDMQRGVDLMLDPALTQGVSADLLARIAPTLASVIPASAELTPVDDLEQGTQPFVVVSDLPPEGSDPRLRLDAGVVELRNAAGDLMFNGGDLDGFAMAQIVSVATRTGTRTGLWLRPGSGSTTVPTQARPLILDRGDVALIDAEGIAFATTTTRGNLVQIDYPEQRDIGEIINQYRKWIALGVWLLITLVVIRILHKLYASRKAAGADQ